MYLIEGNIGAGKSTCVSLLSQALADVYVVSEPVHMWHTQQAHTSLLGHFIQDPQRWAFTMETYAMLSRMRDHMYYQAYHTPVILERSVYSGHYCFACNGFRQGFMTQKEWDIYIRYFYHYIPRFCKPPRGFIFLDVSPDVAYQRIHKRARDHEEMIPRSYLQQLDEMHRSFLIDKYHVLPEIQDTPVLRIPVDDDFAEDPKRQHEIIQQVKDFIYRHA